MPFVISFAGLRGGISLVAALSIPLVIGGRAFADRDLILFATFCVIVATLIGQGLALPTVIRWLGLGVAGRREAAALKACELTARVKGIDAAIAKLDALVECGDIPKEIAASVRRYHRDRRTHFNDTADPDIPGSPVAEYAHLSFALIAAERRALQDSYGRAEIDDGARRRIERELDLEEARLHHVTESAVGDSGDPGIAGQD